MKKLDERDIYDSFINPYFVDLTYNFTSQIHTFSLKPYQN